MVVYLFDGSFEGLLTTIFDSYKDRHPQKRIALASGFQAGLLESTISVVTDTEKAERVWNGLEKRIGKEKRHAFYTVFLSESPEAFQHMLEYALYIFYHSDNRSLDYGNRHVQALALYAKQVSRERHRMKAFVRFNQSASGLYSAVVEPDFNVLPLIAKHFADRFADQKWMIFDNRRNYGIYYDGSGVSEVRLAEVEKGCTLRTDVTVDEKDPFYTSLWQTYFKSTNIKERANLKLHIQHVPKRYWKYLPEKQVGSQ
jgi:probable DNA metabolism protein